MAVPLYPYFDKSSHAVADLSQQSGAIGYARDGITIFSPYAGRGNTTRAWNALAADGRTTDRCGGQTTPQGEYHYHTVPSCLLADLESSTTSHAAQIGWAADGFPIYGPVGPDGIEMKRCGSGAHESVCLDECGGYHAPQRNRQVCVSVLHNRANERPKRRFLHHQLPIFHIRTPFCLKGCRPHGADGWKPLIKPCSADAISGFSELYVPTRLDAGRARVWTPANAWHTAFYCSCYV